MKKTGSIMAVLMLTLVAAGCYRTVYRGEDLASMTAMNRSQPNETHVSHFEEEIWNHYFLFALIPTSEPDLKTVIE
jgi:hypothetical protein